LSRADALILEAATGARRLTRAELQQVLAHVAQAGFDPDARERAGGRLQGLLWRGRVLRGSDLLSPAEAHYLRHVVAQQEWPPGTTLDDYLASIPWVILDPRSGVLISQYQGKGWHLAVVRRSEEFRGPEGSDWILVEYRVATGHWMTAFQPRTGLTYFDDPRRRDKRWVRRPR
jgi:hypothetical protein